MKLLKTIALCVAAIFLFEGNAFGQLTVDSVALEAEVLVTNNAGQSFTDSFLVNDFDSSDAVQAETEFLMPLPEFHSANATVEATRLGNTFQVFALAFADVNFNLFADDFLTGGFAEATGSATIDFTLDSPYSFTLVSVVSDDTAPIDLQVDSSSTVSLIRLADDSLIDPLTETALAPGSYSFVTTIALSASPDALFLPLPPGSFFGEASGSISASSSLSLTAVPEPSGTLLLGLIGCCSVLLRRRRLVKNPHEPN